MTEKCKCTEQCKCGENCKCGDKSGQDHHEDHCHCEEKFLRLADEAWMEILKEKIKVEVEKKQGDNLQKLAEIISKANSEKWKHKITIKSKCEEYKNNLKDFFTCKD